MQTRHLQLLCTNPRLLSLENILFLSLHAVFLAQERADSGFSYKLVLFAREEQRDGSPFG